jgi:cbb3-type cytochrome oxidase subunit 3
MRRTEKNTSRTILIVIDIIALILVFIFWLLVVKYTFRPK